MTPYILAIIVLACLGAGLWLYRRGRERERLRIAEGAVEAERRRERINAKVALMDSAERADTLESWMRDRGN